MAPEVPAQRVSGFLADAVLYPGMTWCRNDVEVESWTGQVGMFLIQARFGMAPGLWARLVLQTAELYVLMKDKLEVASCQHAQPKAQHDA